MARDWPGRATKATPAAAAVVVVGRCCTADIRRDAGTKACEAEANKRALRAPADSFMLLICVQSYVCGDGIWSEYKAFLKRWKFMGRQVFFSIRNSTVAISTTNKRSFNYTWKPFQMKILRQKLV